MADDKELECIVSEIIEDCRSIPLVAEHIINRCSTFVRLRELIPKEKILGEIYLDVETLRWRTSSIHELVMEKLKHFV